MGILRTLIMFFRPKYKAFDNVLNYLDTEGTLKNKHFLEISESLFSEDLRQEIQTLANTLNRNDNLRKDKETTLESLSQKISDFDACKGSQDDNPNSDFNQIYLNPFLAFLALTHFFDPNNQHKITSIESYLTNTKLGKKHGHLHSITETHYNVDLTEEEDLNSLNGIFEKAAQNPENIFEYMFEFYDEMRRILASKTTDVQANEITTMSLTITTYRNNVTSLRQDRKPG